MNFRTKPQTKQEKIILVAQDRIHTGALHGLASNGGKKSINNYIVEFVNDGSAFTTLQIFQCALGIEPKVQSWNRTKTKVVKTEVIKYKKPEKPKIEFQHLGEEEI